MLGHALQSLGSMPLLGTRLTALHRDNKQHCSNKSQLPAASKQASPAHCWSATLRPLPACNFGGCPQRRRGRRGVTSILGNFEPKARFGDQNTAHSKDFIFQKPPRPAQARHDVHQGAARARPRRLERLRVLPRFRPPRSGAPGDPRAQGMRCLGQPGLLYPRAPRAPRRGGRRRSARARRIPCLGGQAKT